MATPPAERMVHISCQGGGWSCDSPETRGNTATLRLGRRCEAGMRRSGKNEKRPDAGPRCSGPVCTRDPSGLPCESRRPTLGPSMRDSLQAGLRSSIHGLRSIDLEGMYVFLLGAGPRAAGKRHRPGCGPPPAACPAACPLASRALHAKLVHLQILRNKVAGFPCLGFYPSYRSGCWKSQMPLSEKRCTSVRVLLLDASNDLWNLG